MSASTEVWYAVRDESFADHPIADDEWLCASPYVIPKDPAHGSDFELESLAACLADHYWYRHDGREASWPLIIIIGAGPEGPEVARVSVEAEPSIHFSGRLIARGDGGAS